MSIDFETIEIRKAKNGFVIVITTEDETNEYVVDTPRKAIKFVKEYVDAKASTED